MKKNPTGSVPLHGKRFLFWFTALVLILACVPATPMPVPTLSADQVNFFIQQTADAASIQTLAAAPTFTPSPTFTATPRNTFTPEPSATPFVTFVIPTYTPENRSLYYRVKHDSQLAMYNFKSRTADWDRDQTPEVVPMFAAPKDASGTQRTILDGAWEYYMNDLNGFDRDKLRYLKASNTALFNGAGFPNLESLTMGGNVITLDAIQGDWGEVHTFDFHEVGTTENETYMTRPDLVHKFVVVVWSSTRKKTYWVNPPRGNLYWPLVTSHPAWISLSRIEPFPILPMEVTGRVEQEILKEPARDGEPTGEKLSKAEKATVVEYHLAGSQVWGRLSTGRWIALFRYETTGPTYFTTWSMETLPPPP